MGFSGERGVPFLNWFTKYSGSTAQWRGGVNGEREKGKSGGVDLRWVVHVPSKKTWFLRPSVGQGTGIP